MSKKFKILIKKILKEKKFTFIEKYKPFEESEIEFDFYVPIVPGIAILLDYKDRLQAIQLTGMENDIIFQIVEGNELYKIKELSPYGYKVELTSNINETRRTLSELFVKIKEENNKQQQAWKEYIDTGNTEVIKNIASVPSTSVSSVKSSITENVSINSCAGIVAGLVPSLNLSMVSGALLGSQEFLTKNSQKENLDTPKLNNNNREDSLFLNKQPSRFIQNINFETKHLAFGGIAVLIEKLIYLIDNNKEVSMPIQEEFNRLKVEINASHNQAIILQCGRCAETIIYVIAESWNIPLTTNALSIINKLHNTLNAIEKIIVQYSYEEDQTRRKGFKNTLIDDTLPPHQKFINSMLINLDDIRVKQSDNNKGNRRSIFLLINELIKKSKQDFPKNARDINEIGNKLEQIYEDLSGLRNRAAHGGETKERITFTKEDSLKAQKLLYEFINCIVNIYQLVFSK